MAALSDPRVVEYARMLVEDAIDAQPGWQVIVYGDALAEPLLREISRALARRGAYTLRRWGPNYDWLAEAPEAMLDRLSAIEVGELEQGNARISIEAPANTRDESVLSPERRARWIQSRREHTTEYGVTKPLIICQLPTDALAQEAGLRLAEFEDVLYDAVLVDYEAMRRSLRGVLEAFDAADTVRIVGAGTDLRISLAGRKGEIDAGDGNIPAGEVYYAPVEDSAEGVIEFSEFPASYAGHEISGIRLRFERGRVVEASAASNEAALLSVLDADEGARGLGELGLGGNPGIQRYLKNTLFDEKIDGTIHLALGQSYEHLGGKNSSGIHWDIVKDLRPGGELYADERLVQKDGKWLL